MKPDGIYLTNYNILQFKFHENKGWNIHEDYNWVELHKRLANKGGWKWAIRHEDGIKMSVVPGELWSW